MKKIKKIYIVVGIIFIILICLVGYLINDFRNDKSYLISQGFTEDGVSYAKEFTGHDDYCKGRSELKERDTICEIYYIKSFVDPEFTMNLNMGDGTGVSYKNQVRGIQKKETTSLIFEFGMYEEEYEGAYCEIDKDFNVVENDKNDAYCYTDDYDKFIKKNQGYLDETIDMYNSYYNGFNMARSFLT